MTTEEAVIKEIELQTRLIAENDEAGRKLFVLIITVFGVFAGVYASDKVFSFPNAKTWLLLALSQILYIVLLKLVVEFALQSLRVGLKSALEEHANTLLNANVFLWESYVASQAILGLRSSMVLASGILWLMTVGGYMVVGYVAYLQFERAWFIWIIIVELCLLLLFGVLSIREAAAIKRSCLLLLRAGTTSLPMQETTVQHEAFINNIRGGDA